VRLKAREPARKFSRSLKCVFRHAAIVVTATSCCRRPRSARVAPLPIGPRARCPIEANAICDAFVLQRPPDVPAGRMACGRPRPCRISPISRALVSALRPARQPSGGILRCHWLRGARRPNRTAGRRYGRSYTPLPNAAQVLPAFGVPNAMATSRTDCMGRGVARRQSPRGAPLRICCLQLRDSLFWPLLAPSSLASRRSRSTVFNAPQ